MEKKKMIGTIIGVIAFIALIATATYAWITSALTVTNNSYVSKTMNFIVNYTKGTNITAMPPSLKNSAATPSNTTSLTVKASKGTNSAPGTMTIYINTTSESNDLLADGLIHYGYCIGTCTSFAGTGSITKTGRTAIISNTVLQASATNYNIYLWIDGDANDGTYVGQVYGGYIEAVATQTS